MEPKDISKKDQIILQQMEVIRSMTEHNLNRMGADFWGAPLTPETAAPASPAKGAAKPDRKSVV